MNLILQGGCYGLVDKREDSQPRGRELKSLPAGTYCILDGM